MPVPAPGPVSAADRAHVEIRRRIADGELPPGTLLSENELAASLSVSRTPVRAALARLRDEGWITVLPQRGALVRALSETDLREAAQVRHALECAGVRAVDPADRSALVDRLRAALDEQADALADRDFTRFVGLGTAFHRTFAAAAGNELMLSLYDRLQDRQALSIIRSRTRIQRDPVGVLDDHRTLLRHLAAGDWAAFADHLQSHQVRWDDESTVYP
ncbi:GntR family transcriptional regulator [Nakamurella flava]|uniref:GntR family transcriptional regulator n=1 Tax=Nakamurella flava TaxID=2576308 RepID=A0A4U6QJ56_9ACTN|nr:GntR family transcriptional regulator [Nakamurella flava]TKV60477.1 GntR family transcriptional regulator [Nakamurella flava]